jgi:VWFA-related protein
MKNMSVLFPFLVASLLAAPGVGPAAGEEAAQAVTTDIVVQTKKGEPVRDLRPDEVKITEAGLAREVSLRFVDSSTGPGPRLITLVFDWLDEQGRSNAQKAARDFIAQVSTQPDVQVAVFRIGLELWALCPYTRDVAVLQKAVDRATSHEDETLRPDSNTTLTHVAREAGVPETGELAKVVLEIMRVGDQMHGMRQDNSPLFPLIALAKGQGTLPGRKTLVYFSPGLDVPQKFDEVFQSLVSECNRSGVAVYTVDARGLRSDRELSEARDAMDDVSSHAVSRSQNLMNPESARNTADRDYNVATATRKDTRSILGSLAERTAGRFLANSNDLKKATQDVLADSGGYYLVSYPPSSKEFDGKFREVKVEVARKDTRLRSRTGYYAFPPETGGQTVLGYEVPMLTALVAPEPARDLELHGGIFRFAQGERGHQHVMMLDVPMSGLHFALDETAKTYRLSFGLLALVRDQQGAIVQKISQVYPFEGPADKVEAMKLGNVHFDRPVLVPPGRYTYEVAVHDRETQKVGCLKKPFEVPEPSPLRLSTVTVVRSVVPVPEDKLSVESPFRIQTAQVLPNFDTPISKATNQNFYLYAVAWADGPGVPEVSLEFSRGGSKVGRAPGQLLPPDEKGRMVFLGEYPLSGFEPGDYDVLVKLAQGRSSVEEHARFTVVP